jgi:hypothetical protein
VFSSLAWALSLDAYGPIDSRESEEVLHSLTQPSSPCLNSLQMTNSRCIFYPWQSTQHPWGTFVFWGTLDYYKVGWKESLSLF